MRRELEAGEHCDPIKQPGIFGVLLLVHGISPSHVHHLREKVHLSAHLLVAGDRIVVGYGDNFEIMAFSFVEDIKIGRVWLSVVLGCRRMNV
jgi:hypothetical protein